MTEPDTCHKHYHTFSTTALIFLFTTTSMTLQSKTTFPDVKRQKDGAEHSPPPSVGVKNV